MEISGLDHQSLSFILLINIKMPTIVEQDERGMCIRGKKWPPTKLSDDDVKYSIVIALHEINNKICV